MRIVTLLTLLCVAFLVLFGQANCDMVENPPAMDAEDDAPCACPRLLDPVCATDKRTYPNQCEFLCAQRKSVRSGRSLNLAHRGQC